MFLQRCPRGTPCSRDGSQAGRRLIKQHVPAAHRFALPLWPRHQVKALVDRLWAEQRLEYHLRGGRRAQLCCPLWCRQRPCCCQATGRSRHCLACTWQLGLGGSRKLSACAPCHQQRAYAALLAHPTSATSSRGTVRGPPESINSSCLPTSSCRLPPAWSIRPPGWTMVYGTPAGRRRKGGGRGGVRGQAGDGPAGSMVSINRLLR